MQVSDAGFFKFVWPFSGHQTVKGQFNKSVYSLSLSTFKIYEWMSSPWQLIYLF